MGTASHSSIKHFTKMYGGSFASFLPLFTSLWTDSGIVPTYLPEAPLAPIRAYWPSSGLAPRQNETVDTGDILERPLLKWKADRRSLYTVMVVDFGVDAGGANFVHWMKHDVRMRRRGGQGTEMLSILHLGPLRGMQTTLLLLTLEML